MSARGPREITRSVIIGLVGWITFDNPVAGMVAILQGFGLYIATWSGVPLSQCVVWRCLCTLLP